MWSSSVSENEQRADTWLKTFNWTYFTVLRRVAVAGFFDALRKAVQTLFFHRQYVTVNGRPCDKRSFISGWLPKDARLTHCDQKYGRGGSVWRGSFSNATEGNPPGVAA